MPMPGALEPIPVPPRLSRVLLPDEAQEASYLAASARMASFCGTSSWDTCSLYVPRAWLSSHRAGCRVIEIVMRRDVAGKGLAAARFAPRLEGVRLGSAGMATGSIGAAIFTDKPLQRNSVLL